MSKNNFYQEKDPLDFNAPRTAEEPAPVEQHDGCCGPEQSPDVATPKRHPLLGYIPAAISLLLLLTGIILDIRGATAFQGTFRLLLYSLAYLLVGFPVLKQAGKNILRGQVFNEFFLMGIATLGAFYLGEYAEGVAVMLFYVIGEHIQELAVARSRRSIKSLIDARPSVVEAYINGHWQMVEAASVQVGSRVRLKAGERVALDGVLVGPAASFDTAALTGEPVPKQKQQGDAVLAGMINRERVTEMQVEAPYTKSTLAKLLNLIEEAAGRKAKTQRFITRFAKVYTPIVVMLALAIVLLPALWVDEYLFNVWLYRALVFLVISCPCALVVSIPLGYFGGIGAASRHGILFKGANFLDAINTVDMVALDKTGTLTHGVFRVKTIKPVSMPTEQFMQLVSSLESHSNHPVARAIMASSPAIAGVKVEAVEEKAGMGMKGLVEGKTMLAGSTRLLKFYGIPYDAKLDALSDTLVVVAIDSEYQGYITIADELKEDARDMVEELKTLGVSRLVILSGDKTAVVKSLAIKLGIEEYAGDLLPQDKLLKVEEWAAAGRRVLFAGDGLNDAPVISRADIGVAMGGLGSDAAIETADVVIQSDQPSKIATAFRLGRKTKKIVWQNIGLAFGVKLLVLLLGAMGYAALWEAVFADVGVALLAIINAVRLQHVKI
jgi:Cd2+/Zn2+-exporting ATPase